MSGSQEEESYKAKWLSPLEGDKHWARYFEEDATSQLERDQGFSTDSLDTLAAAGTKAQVLQPGSLWRQFQLPAFTFVHDFTSPACLPGDQSYSVTVI